VVLIANISFLFYLLHYQIPGYLAGLRLSVQLTALTGLMATTVAAYLCYILIEKPAHNLTGKQHPHDP